MGTPREFGFVIVEGLAKLAHNKIISRWSGERFTPAALHIHGSDIVVGFGFVVMEPWIIRPPVHRGARGVR